VRCLALGQYVARVRAVVGVRAALVSVLVVATTAGCSSSGSSGARPGSTASPSALTTATSDPSGAPTAPAAGVTTVEAATEAAVVDGFPLLVPGSLPPGWALDRVGYGIEGRGTWFVDVTDADGREVSLRQALVDAPSAYFADVRSAMGSGTPPDGRIDLGPLGTWDTYQSRRDPAVAVASGLVGPTSVVVTADRVSLAAFARTLVDATD